ncbi:hypothetical protein BH11BAC1_BH11BAC1_02790 [soil metagenome]
MKNIFYLSILIIFYPGYCLAQIWDDVGGGVRFHNPMSTNVTALGVYNNELYVGGTFDTAGTLPALFHARWDGYSWDSVGLGFPKGLNGHIETYCVIGNELYVGGNFRGLYSGLPFPFNVIPHTQNLAKWDGVNWSAVSTSDVGGTVDYVNGISYYDGQLYIGGTFNNIGALATNAIASWDGIGWGNVNGGVAGSFQDIEKLLLFNGQLVAIGNFYAAGGLQTNFIAEWNGIDWDSVGGGFDYYAACMEVDSSNHLLFVGGAFYYAGDTNTIVKGSAKWNNNNWSALDTNLCGDFMSMCMYRDKLFAGGNFDYVNCSAGQTCHLAYFDGVHWNPVSGPNQDVLAMTVFNDTLVIGGYFDSVGVAPFNHLAKYFIPVTNVYNQNMKGDFDCYSKQDQLIVHIKNLNGISDGLLQVYDLTGKCIREFPIEFYSNDITLKFNLGGVSVGTYISKLFIGSETVSTKKLYIY